MKKSKVKTRAREIQREHPEWSYTRCLWAAKDEAAAKPNLQNVPLRTDEAKQLRDVFLPTQESAFAEADYAGIEHRIAAQLDDAKKDEE